MLLRDKKYVTTRNAWLSIDSSLSSIAVAPWRVVVNTNVLPPVDVDELTLLLIDACYTQ